MSETKGRRAEVIGKFYVNAYGTIGLILDYNNGNCSWISTGGVKLNYPVSFDSVKESINIFEE